MHARTNPRFRYSALFCSFALMLFCASLFAQDGMPSRAASVLDSMPHAKRIDQVALSPDGTQVAFISNGELAVIPADGGSSHTIAVEANLSIRDVAGPQIASVSHSLPIFMATFPLLKSGSPQPTALLRKSMLS